MYINELILKATEKEDPHQKVFDIYETLLKNLSQNRDRVVLEKLLRDFELSLLQEMGYGIDLSRDAQTNKIINKKKFYILFVICLPLFILCIYIYTIHWYRSNEVIFFHKPLFFLTT